jgi:hypothetical protein
MEKEKSTLLYKIALKLFSEEMQKLTLQNVVILPKKLGLVLLVEENDLFTKYLLLITS